MREHYKVQLLYKEKKSHVTLSSAENSSVFDSLAFFHLSFYASFFVKCNCAC